VDVDDPCDDSCLNDYKRCIDKGGKKDICADALQNCIEKC
jgi:hypothetical protein